MATPISGASRWLTINGRGVSFETNTENAALNILEYAENTIRITRDAPDRLSLWIDGEKLQTARYGIWTWRPQDYAGLYRFEVQAPGSERCGTWIRVFPRKLTQRLYETMKNELSEIALDLLYRLDSPANERAEHAPRVQDTSPLHDYKLLCGIFEELQDVMVRIRRDPHHTLHAHNVQRDWQTRARFSADASPLPGSSIALPEALAQKYGLHSLPASWLTQERRLTYDTYENRLLKQFLQNQLVPKLT